MDLMVSSAVNLPITSASLRLVVVWMGVRSMRWTYSEARAPLRFTFTMNFVFFGEIAVSMFSLFRGKGLRSAIARYPVEKSIRFSELPPAGNHLRFARDEPATEPGRAGTIFWSKFKSFARRFSG